MAAREVRACAKALTPLGGFGGGSQRGLPIRMPPMRLRRRRQTVLHTPDVVVALCDDAGHIAYYPHALVPRRDFADPRVVGANVIPPWFPLPGDGTAEWGDGVSSCAGVGATPVPQTFPAQPWF